jgi:hypothetical protein
MVFVAARLRMMSEAEPQSLAKMEDLSAELLVMIFGEVYRIELNDPHSNVSALQRLRFVSQKFNAAVIPFVYRQRNLRARCLTDVFTAHGHQDPLAMSELASIRSFTRDLVMPDYNEMSDRLVEAVANAISTCRHLESLK